MTSTTLTRRAFPRLDRCVRSDCPRPVSTGHGASVGLVACGPLPEGPARGGWTDVLETSARYLPAGQFSPAEKLLDE